MRKSGGDVIIRHMPGDNIQNFEKFAAFYDAKLKDPIVRLESRRELLHGIRLLLKNVSKLAFVSFVVSFAISGYFGLTSLNPIWSELLAFLFFDMHLVLALIVVNWIIINKASKRFVDDFRSTVLPLFVDYFGKSFKVESGRQIAADLLEASLIVDPGDRQEVSFQIKGSWRKVPIDIYHIKNWKNNPKSKEQPCLVFDGIFITLPVRRVFKGTTLVLTDQGSLKRIFSRYEHTSFESVEFEKGFDVFTTDKIEARYLLPPDVMARLMDMKNSYGGSIQCAFTDQHLYVTLAGGRGWLLPRGVDFSVLDTKDMQSILRQMHDIFSLIDLLDEDYLIARDESSCSVSKEIV